MNNTERIRIKPQLLKCAKENENRGTFTGYVIVSSVCRAAIERIEELERQIENMKCCQNCKHLNSLAYGEFACDLYGECKHYSKWEIKEND